MKLSSMLCVAAAASSLSLSACGGGGDDDDPSGATDAFAAVDDAARAAFGAEHIDGGLAIYDSHGTKVFEHMYGNFSPDQRVPIASASKLVSGVTLFRLIDQGYLSLDSTTGQVLGWTGDEGGITLRELMSFTSGLQPENRCTYQSDVTPSDIAYYANPLKATGTDNALLAGGLRVSMNEYEHVLHFVFDKGVWNGAALLAPALFDTQSLAPYPNAVIGNSPAEGGLRYGLAAWLECSTPATGCSRISSAGAFGFTPWLDRAAGYYAILGMEDQDNRSTHFGSQLEQQLQPLIVEALSHE